MRRKWMNLLKISTRHRKYKEGPMWDEEYKKNPKHKIYTRENKQLDNAAESISDMEGRVIPPMLNSKKKKKKRIFYK